MALDAEAVHGVISHMNEDHSDAILIYAQVYAGLSQATQAHMTDMTSQYMDIKTDEADVRIYFNATIEDRESSRLRLVELLKLARSGKPPQLKFTTLPQS